MIKAAMDITQGSGHFQFSLLYHDKSIDGEVIGNNSGFLNETLNSTGPLSLSKRGATIVSPTLMFMFGLIGNTLALIVLYQTKTEIRRTMFYTLVAGLAWTDITGQVLTSPISIYTYINGLNWPGGQQLCKFNGFIMGCFGLSTPCLVCAMAVERFLAIKCPYFYSKYCTRSAARVTILLLWGAVLLICILPLMGFGEYSLQYPGTWCFLNFHTSNPVLMSYGFLYAGLNLIIIIVMTGCNIFVGATLLKVRFVRRYSTYYHCDQCELSTHHNQTYSSTKRKQQQHAVQIQMIWIMCAITTVFAVCCAPLMIQILRTLLTGRDDFMGDLMGVRLTSINQILDPWLYILVRRSFLQKIVKCCRKLLSLSPSSQRPGARVQRPVTRALFHPTTNCVQINALYREGGNSQNVRVVVDNDIVGLYTACPHCRNERRKETVSSLAVCDNSVSHLPDVKGANVCDNSVRHLPDVMGANDSKHSDHSLPDVTPEGATGRTNFVADVHDAVPENSITSGYYDTESEPIYVDMFLLPRNQTKSSVSMKPKRAAADAPVQRDLLSERTVTMAESSVFGDGGSTSGISSWNNPPPRRPFRSDDVNVYTERLGDKHTDKTGNGRRTKSYT